LLKNVLLTFANNFTGNCHSGVRWLRGGGCASDRVLKNSAKNVVLKGKKAEKLSKKVYYNTLKNFDCVNYL
jgi:hypothetical protein